jgi:hypothetical protein
MTGDMRGGGQDLATNVEDLGTVTVEFWRWKRRKPRKKQRTQRPSIRPANAKDAIQDNRTNFEVVEEVEPIESVPEKAMKGKAIHVTARYGQQQRAI